MSINRIARQPFINLYNMNSNKGIEGKVNEKKNIDTIEISKLAKSMGKYSLDIDMKNSDRIAEIKDKIKNGTYTVDSKMTANSILKHIEESKS